MTKIYVGNLPFDVTEDQLQQMFAEFGAVDKVALISDRMTGRSRGFGFVEMTNDTEAQAAIQGLNGKDLGGRAMNVNVARPQTERHGGGGGGGHGGYGGGGGGGGGRGGRDRGSRGGGGDRW
jgi:RNA recognition motif-containing protein